MSAFVWSFVWVLLMMLAALLLPAWIGIPLFIIGGAIGVFVFLVVDGRL